MPDFFTLKDIFALLFVFGGELYCLLEGITYYKFGKALYGIKEIFGWAGNDFVIAFPAFALGSILFIFFNMMLLGALVARSIIGIILFSLHDLGLFIIIRRYLKGLEANQIGEAESE